METPKTEDQKNKDREAKIALTPLFEKLLDRKPTNFENVTKMQELIDAKQKEPIIEQTNSLINTAEEQGLAKIDPVPVTLADPAKTETTGEVVIPEVKTPDVVITKSLERLGISVVIPYLASAARGVELMYALRSWAEHYGDCHIIIIGDKPDFISDEVIHIPAAVSSESVQLDIVAKMMQAIASDQITENFIWSNDDIYLVNFMEEAEISALKSIGPIGQVPNSGSGYQDKLHKTKAALLAARYPTHNYATHTPFVFNKEKLAKVIAKYKADQEPLLLSCLYFNSVFPKDKPIVISGGIDCEQVVYVYRSNPNLQVLRHAVDNRKLLNHNNEGYEAVLPFLQEIFPDKCKFEI